VVRELRNGDNYGDLAMERRRKKKDNIKRIIKVNQLYFLSSFYLK
jgi:hypothetical protein